MSRFNLTYNRGGEIVELKIMDSNGYKLDTFKCTLKDFPKIISVINRKYGLNFHPEITKPIDKDLEWLKD